MAEHATYAEEMFNVYFERLVSEGNCAMFTL